MGRPWIAQVFDDSLRPHTTGIHVLRAPDKQANVVHFRPNRRDAIPATDFDLHLSVDDDTDHQLPDHLRPLACRAIDTHLGFEARLGRARRAVFVLAAQKDGAEGLAEAGIARPVCLPQACDPDVRGAGRSAGGGGDGDPASVDCDLPSLNCVDPCPSVVTSLPLA